MKWNYTPFSFAIKKNHIKNIKNAASDLKIVFVKHENDVQKSIF